MSFLEIPMISELYFRKYSKLTSLILLFVRIAGLLENAAWYSGILVHFFISLNRFCLFVFPLRYNRIWSEKKAFTVGIVCCSLGILLSFPILLGKLQIGFLKVNTTLASLLPPPVVSASRYPNVVTIAYTGMFTYRIITSF